MRLSPFPDFPAHGNRFPCRDPVLRNLPDRRAPGVQAADIVAVRPQDGFALRQRRVRTDALPLPCLLLTKQDRNRLKRLADVYLNQ